MRRILVGFILGLLFFAQGASALLLVSGAKSEYVIVVGDDAITPELAAAAELQQHLAMASGANLPIQRESETAADAKVIMVGPCARFTAAFPEVDLAALEQDGIVMKTGRDALYLAGGRPRGTLNAVYTFLEDIVGCRWWTSYESVFPAKRQILVPDLDTIYTPKLRYREAFYRGAFDGLFAARMKCNGHHDQVPPELGGHYSILGWCHTFYQLLSPDKYFEEHPEWYSEIGGKRVRDGAQLCLSNDEMRAELVKNALEWLRKSPDAGIISISQNDCHGWCQCPKCLAVEAEEGTHSGPIIRFVNAVAEEIEKEFPDVWVETLAYSYTRQAPKLAVPRKNVVIRLCTIECSFSQPLATGPQNESFRTDIEAWSAIAPQLYVWDYVTNFSNYILPHPNLRVLGPNIQYFVDHKVIGLFEQGDSQSTCGDFVEMRTWVLSHLMWDPARDPEALIKEFMNGYYGAAAEPLLDYLTLTLNAVERADAYLACYMPDTSAWFGLYDVNRATELFTEAEKRVADDPILRTRVRRARMPLDHVWLKRYAALKRQAKGEKKPFLGPEDPKAFCEEFIRTAESFDVGSYAEGRPFNDYAPLLRARFQDPGPAPKECEGLAEEDWVAIQNVEFSLASPGKWAETVSDADASEGGAARMPANHTQWAVQYPVSADLCALNPAHCYVVVKCVPKAASGNAFTLGIYDSRAGAEVTRKTVTIEEAGNNVYQACDLGVHELKPGMYFWVAPIGDEASVESVFVDRIFCIRSK